VTAITFHRPRQQLERESRVAGEAMKAPPDNLHATRVRESETVGCDYYHNRADIGPRSNLKPLPCLVTKQEQYVSLQ
jgi:hypothetical protein